MPENVQPETMATWMRDVERRLRMTESRKFMPIVQAPQSGASSFVTRVSGVSALYATVYEFFPGPTLGDAISVRLAVETIGAAVDIRLASRKMPPFPTAGFITDEISVSVGTEAVIGFDWIPSSTITPGEGYFPAIAVQYRITSGVGDVDIYHPHAAYQAMADDVDAATDGNPRFVL